jgi:hypothetical protein
VPESSTLRFGQAPHRSDRAVVASRKSLRARIKSSTHDSQKPTLGIMQPCPGMILSENGALFGIMR